MFVIADKFKLNALAINSRKVWLFLLLTFIFTGCSKKDSDPGDYSDAFQKVFNQTSHYFDFNQPAQGIYYLDSAFAHINKPTVNDKFRFYAFHYVYAQKVKLNYNKALALADSMLVTAQKSTGKQQYASNFAEANYAKGDSYFSLNQYNDSYQCYFQGYLIAKNYLNKRSLADYTYRMGMIMYKQARYKQAAQYFKDSYVQSLSVPDDGKDDFPAFYRR